MKYAVIIVSRSHKNIDHIFHYKIPQSLQGVVLVGMRVLVPFGKGNNNIEGYVIGFSDTADVEEDKIKYITSVMDHYPLFSEHMIDIAMWMKEKYYAMFGECLSCVIPKITNEKTFDCACINEELPNFEGELEKIIKKRNKQSGVLEMLLGGNEIPVSHIESMLDITRAPITALVKKGIVRLNSIQVYRGNYNSKNIARSEKMLPNEEQKIAIDFITQKLRSDEKKPILMHGVTASGKTEVYLQAIEAVLNEGKQAIVLVPEISLTPQTVERFIARFGNRVAVTHSRLSDGERFDQWNRARLGEISIMIGPRSAVFTPFEKLGIIVVDEEHENTYKSDQTPKYDAREVAIERCQRCNALTVLGSATPSVESYYRAQNGEYDLVEMKNRVNNSFPNIEVVDMRRELETGNKSIFSNALAEAIKKNIEIKKQTILFLNRRGFSTFVSCRKCGHVMTCDSCNVNYTYHFDSNRLVCHYCGKSIKNPDVCPECGSNFIRYFGVGTQKIEQEVIRLFPTARVMRMDLDTTKKKNSFMAILEGFKNGDADILIGTQMIAKGLDFPNVTLVGVIAVDMSLNINDYHAAENTFQLVTQVAGRAGRAQAKGNVFIQTYSPENYSIQCARDNDYLKFYNEEIAFRKQLNYPPFSNIFFIMFSGKNEKEIIKCMYRLLDIMNHYNRDNSFEHLGPAPANISKINDNYRWRIIVRGSEEKRVKNYVVYCINKLQENESMKNININMVLNPNYGF